jgi:hypothetical protein
MAIERGMFWCPREAKKRRFRLRSARRWIRVGSLAAIRLPSRGNYYECASCHSTCEVGTLHSMAGSEEDGAGAAEDVVTTLVRYLAVQMLGHHPQTIDADVHRQAVIVIQRFSTRAYRAGDLDADRLKLGAENVAERVDHLAGRLSDRGRAMVLDAVSQIAEATCIDAATASALVARTALQARVPKRLVLAAAAGPRSSLLRATVRSGGKNGRGRGVDLHQQEPEVQEQIGYL